MIKTKVGDIIHIPHVENGIAVNREISILNNNYNTYKWQNNLIILDLLDDNTHAVSPVIKCHHYLIYSDGGTKSTEYIYYIWNNLYNVASIAIYQLTCHRLYDDGFCELAIKLLDDSIDRALRINAYKWVVSGRFFKAIYSSNKEQELIQILNSTINIDLDCYIYKISLVILWLKVFGSEESKNTVTKYCDCLPDYVKQAIAWVLDAKKEALHNIESSAAKFDWYGCYNYINEYRVSTACVSQPEHIHPAS